MAYGAMNYSWEFYPPPYDFLSPVCPPPGGNPAAARAAGWSGGLSGCGCGGTCGGCGSHGMGLFDSGLDYTQWGWQEWAALAAIVYVGHKLITDVGRAGKGVSRSVRRLRA